jgi:hypothetical protein
LFFQRRRNGQPRPRGKTLLLTILQFTGSAIVGIFYITILVALATRKKPATAETQEDPGHHLGPVA